MITYTSDNPDPNKAQQENEIINEMLATLEVSYINPLKKVKDKEKLENLVQYQQAVGQMLGQNTAQLLFDPEKIIEACKELLDVDRSLINSNDVIKAMVVQQQELEAKLLEQQQMSPSPSEEGV